MGGGRTGRGGAGWGRGSFIRGLRSWGGRWRGKGAEKRRLVGKGA